MSSEPQEENKGCDEDGFYVVETIHGTRIVEHCRAKRPWPEHVNAVLAGPFQDVDLPGGRKISGSKVAFENLIKIQSNRAFSQ